MLPNQQGNQGVSSGLLKARWTSIPLHSVLACNVEYITASHLIARIHLTHAFPQIYTLARCFEMAGDTGTDVFHDGCCSVYYKFAGAAVATLLVLYLTRVWLTLKDRFGIRNYASLGELEKASDILSADDVKYVKESTKMFVDTEKRHKDTAGYEGHAKFVSEFLKQKVIDVDGLMRHNTQKLFLLHRESGPLVEGGLGVRITVQLNLFGGSVANLGNQEQKKWLQGVFDRGELGCFCLTEAGAGVLSGLVVNTTATFIPPSKKNGTGTFELHSPTLKSRKTWISQGLTAKWAVVIARLILNDVDKGPHAFVVDISSSKNGICKEDMPSKTDFNGLDNANIWFEHTSLPLDSLLSGVSYVDADGEYILRDPNVPFRFVTVAQRLLSGRICIAGAAIMQLKKVYDNVKSYASEREIPTGKDIFRPLSEIPVMHDTLDSIDASMCVFRHFVRANEESFMRDTSISADLVNRIACGKVEIVGYCIDAILTLKARVGSLSLQATGPFGSQTDILYVYRFAEGDSAILQQKMTRDALKRIGTLPGILRELLSLPFQLLANKHGLGSQRIRLSIALVQLAVSMIGLSREDKMTAWFKSHGLVERVAKMTAMLTIYDAVCEREGLKGTRELRLFKKIHLESL